MNNLRKDSTNSSDEFTELTTIPVPTFANHTNDGPADALLVRKPERSVEDGDVGKQIDRIPAEKFDPFKARVVEHPTSDCDTLIHLLKGSLGTGILAMPHAFKNAGLTFGAFSTFFVALVCTHCMYILVKCAHVMYHRTRVTALGFADVGVAAFTTGPPWAKKYTQFARLTILISLFLTYFGTCSVYTVIVARNIQQVIEQHCLAVLNDRIYIGALLIPLILIGCVRNLKYLAPFSMIANAFMAVGIGITMYYLLIDIPPMSERVHVGRVEQFPIFFSTTVFAMEAIGVVMPLENNMKTPRHFLGWRGVLNVGMTFVAVVYAVLGFFGYLKYGDNTMGSITLNLPNDEVLAQSVKILIALAVFFTYGLQFYVCNEIIWNIVKQKNSTVLMELIVRSSLVTATVILAVAVPTIGPFTSLVGAVCFSILGIICPALIETVTFWETGLGRYRWLLWKNVAVCVIGVMAFIFGTYTSVEDIIKLYQETSERPEVCVAS